MAPSSYASTRPPLNICEHPYRIRGDSIAAVIAEPVWRSSSDQTPHHIYLSSCLDPGWSHKQEKATGVYRGQALLSTLFIPNQVAPLGTHLHTSPSGEQARCPPVDT